MTDATNNANMNTSQTMENPYAPPTVSPKAQPYSPPVTQPYVPADAQRRPVYTTEPPKAPPVKRDDMWSFTTVQKTFAVITLLLGYLFNRFIFHEGAPGLGALIFFEVALVSFLVYLKKEKSSFKVGNYIWLGVLMLYPVTFLLFDDPVLKGFGALFMVVAVMFWVYSSASGISVFRQTFIYDLFRSTFAAPFRNFIMMPVAVFKPAKDSKTKVLRYILLGLVVAIPFTAIIAALLISSDEAFREMIGIDNIVEEIVDFVWRFIFAIPVAMIIFSIVISAVKNREAVAAKKSSYKGGRMNHIIFVTALIPVILLYIAYFVSQFGYFTGAFSNILPEDYTYAEYARQGFFELCAVVAINILMILLTVLLCKRKENGHVSVGVKCVISVLSLFSAMLVAISVAKIVMYTSAYGLTHKRVYTLWLILGLLVMVAVALLKVYIPRFKFWNAAVTSAVILFVVISFANVDAVIAKYNVKWYQEGKIEWMGEKALYELDKSAVKYLDALYDDESMVLNEIESEYQYYYGTYYSDDDLDSDYGEDARYLEESVGSQIKNFYRYMDSYENDLIGFNISAYEADKVFEKREIEAYDDEYVDYYEEEYV